ncbi:MAG: PD-(D/E)XK nuclease family protein [Ignavibacteria bacterium]|nr:PD-(D/E)XK nuclease family protein [Ignavibacteria bacterium]
MSLSVFGSTDSILQDAAMAPSFDEAVYHLPGVATMVVPTMMHIQRAARVWAEKRAGEPLPQIITMSEFVRNLFKQVRNQEVSLISDIESELLLDLSLKNVGEQFRPSGLSIYHIVRWKQELHTAQSVEEMFTDENRPHRLDAMNRVVRIWHEYEQRKGRAFLDRGDVVQYIIDKAAAQPEAFRKQPVLVMYTHGLSIADRSLLTLLAYTEWDIAVRFSLSGTADDRSRAMATWMVAHGWHFAETEVPKKNSTTILRKWPTKREEVRRTLGAVKELVTNGVHPYDIAVVVPRSGSYDNLIIELASSAKIPISIQKQSMLEHNGSATTILAACHVVSRNWRRTDVDRLIRSGHVHHASMQIGRLYECGAIARVAGGNGWRDWLSQFQGTLGTLRSVNDFDNEKNVQMLVTMFEEGISCLEWLAKTIDISDGFIAPEEFVRWVRENIIQNLGIDPPVSLMHSLETYKHVAKRHVQTETILADHISRWWRIVQTLETDDSNVQVRGITVAKPQELRGLEFKYVMALGFIEGELPLAAWDPINEELLAGIREAMDYEALADIVNSATHEGILVASVPGADDGDETVESKFIDDLAIGSTVIEFKQLSGIHCLDSTSRLVISPSELLAFGTNGVVDFNERQQGVLATALDKDILSRFTKITNGRVSPSRIDTVAQCPFRYFVGYVLGVESRQGIDEVISPISHGSMMHAVAKEFFNQVRGHTVTDISSIDDIKAAMVDLTTHTAEEWLPLLQHIYEEERKKIPGGYLYDIVERSTMYNSDFRAGMLHRWLVVEMESQRSSNFKPALLELEITDEITLSSDVRVPITLRIDRVDVAIREDEVHCIVIDYKTGERSLPKYKDIELGRKSQMPLYAQALRRFFTQRNVKCVLEKGTYHTFGKSIKDSNNPKISERVKNNAEFNTALHNVEQYLDVIRSGSLPVIPIEGACGSCGFKEVCRVDHWGPYHSAQQPSV